MQTDSNMYFTEGCGRCKLYTTPACKVHTWAAELRLLRQILQATGLAEQAKWGMPCYTYNGSNVAMLLAFKGYCGISFFKGSLLADTAQILSQPGENSQVTKLARFTNVADIEVQQHNLRAYIYEAIELEKTGKKTHASQKAAFVYPIELQQVMEHNAAFKAAFEALTPGRKRGYILHFSAAKQASTRLSRIQNCTPKILAGKGFND
jgi:uncharacterized protein YdeI (YjbR/CyaY-like superfamily)